MDREVCRLQSKGSQKVRHKWVTNIFTNFLHICIIYSFNTSTTRIKCKEYREKNRMGKTWDLCKKIRDTKGTFHAKMGSIKDRNVPNRSRRH